jgi:ParD-like antitoxin of type II bacterial toxin-antitoxin system
MSKVIYLPDELIDLAQNCGLKASRSASEQIEYWARIGKAAEENPEIPTDLLIGILQSIEEMKRGIHSEYKFG